MAAAFAGAGCANVRTFIASGNILFDAPRSVGRALDARIRAELARLLARPVIVYRTVDQLQAIVNEAPFATLVNDPRLKLYVIFLAAPPKTGPSYPLSLRKEGLEAIGTTRATGDVLIVSRQKPSGMYGFPNNWIEQALDVTGTTRTWSTVTKVAALGSAGSASGHPAHRSGRMGRVPPKADPPAD